jgi:hypothetical protein
VAEVMRAAAGTKLSPEGSRHAVSESQDG